jgi:hypothetical protein
MPVFLDTSALLKAYLHEPGSGPSARCAAPAGAIAYMLRGAGVPGLPPGVNQRTGTRALRWTFAAVLTLLGGRLIVENGGRLL